MYRKNFFGDITAIYKGATKVAEYKYDAWGNCTITLNTSGYGSRNPFRYRGYYWDEDLNMYYLMTRYYDPKTGRFINADSIEYLEPQTINGLNLYAYCRNNPVMYFDPTGTFIYTCWDEDGIYDLDAETFKSFGGGGGGYIFGATNYGVSLGVGTRAHEPHIIVQLFSDYNSHDWGNTNKKSWDHVIEVSKDIILAPIALFVLICAIPAIVIGEILILLFEDNRDSLSKDLVAAQTQETIGNTSSYTSKYTDGIGGRFFTKMFDEDGLSLLDFDN